MLMRKGLVAAVLVGVLLAGTAVVRLVFPVGVSAEGAGALTTQDYLDIQKLYARYAMAADRQDGKSWSETFTPDGEFYAPFTIKENNNTLKGRDQIAAFLKGPARERPAIRHFYSNITINPAPTGATGNAYMILTNLESNPPSISGGGFYEDVIVKTGDGWRFKKRTYIATLPKPAQTTSR
jgi:hypothetical protein